MEPAVKVSDLHFRYEPKTHLLEGLNLELGKGHVYGLFGRNGTGKTTFLKHLTGLLFPGQGETKVFGKPARARLPSVLADTFLMPENFDLPPISVKQFEDSHAPFYPRFSQDTFHHYLGEWDVTYRQLLTKMSFGQQKKALLAFAVATGARLLLLDEPTNGLDIPSKSQFRQLLAGTVDEDQLVLISTHQVRDLASLIDEVIILEDGAIAFQENILTISDKLVFQNVRNKQDAQVLYAEPAFDGYRAILPANGQETEVDLELLFNGVLANPKAILAEVQGR